MSFADDASLTKISYTDALRRALQSSDTPIRVLDIGCGDGSWLRKLGELFPEVELHGVDVLPSNGETEISKLISYHQTSALSLPFPSAHFQLVHTRKLLSSVSVFTALVEESARVLAPGCLGVWVEGKNVVNSRTVDSSTALNNASGSGSVGLKAILAKKMMASKGLEADLASSLPRLLERSGIFHVQLEELLPRQPGGSSAPQDLGFILDGASEGSATMYAFYGMKI
ncbi:hypothetical protein BDY24DRAFT_402596 [Mrakia frigida]|uniref:class I SAM-dependent methyltransferase n=1 Tax=Mrakia frigida TaxID=29902 RepID=UPI003FCBFA1B